MKWYLAIRSNSTTNWGNEAAIRRYLYFGNRVLESETVDQDGTLTMIVEVSGNNAAGRADYQAGRLRSGLIGVRSFATLAEAREANVR